MQEELKVLLERRCKRTIGVILGVAERELYPSLSADQQAKLRKVVLDTVNDFQGMVIDIMASLDTGDVELNGVWLQKLDEIHRTVVHRPAPEPAR